MVENRDTSDQNARDCERAAVSVPEVLAWFVREILPLEAILTQFLHRNWRNKNEIPDLRQDVYVLVYEAACKKIPDAPKAFTLATARNMLINRIRDESVVLIEAVADLESLEIAADVPNPERSAAARESLRRLQLAVDRLPPRCREVVLLRKIEGVSIHEIATRLGMAEKTVKVHVTTGMRALADALFSEAPDYRGGL